MDLIPATAPHWHLVLNHLPSIGMLVGVCLLAAARVTGSRDLTRASLLLSVALSLVALPTFVTGSAAATAIEGAEDVSAVAVSAHQDAALVALTMLLVTGSAAWFVLWRDRRQPALAGSGPLVVLASGAASLLLMLWTARLGGEIGHPEIHAGEPPPIEALGLSAAIQNGVFSRSWAWPAMEAVHFIGMALLFGVVLLVAVRVLGFARAVPFTALHRLLPLGMLGLAMNIVTGMIFFVVDSSRYAAMTYGFYPKLALIIVGGAAVVYFTVFERPWALGANDEAPASAKAAAVVTVIVWSGVIALGRLLPYIGGE